MPTRPDIHAGKGPGPVSTRGSMSRVEQPRSSLCAGTLLGRVVHSEEALPAGAAQFARECVHIHVQGRCNSVFVPPPPPRKRAPAHNFALEFVHLPRKCAHFRGVRTRVFVPRENVHHADRLILNLTTLSSSVPPEQLHKLR